MRVNFNYFPDEDVFSYIVEAVRLVAREGWKLLGDYRFDPISGLWRHHTGPVEPPLRLGAISYRPDGTLRYPSHDSTAPAGILNQHLYDARRILAAAHPAETGETAHVSADFDHLRWFDLPSASLDSRSPTPRPRHSSS
ncbi:MAG: hypothetical protein LCH76_01265 [Actinobacteria bacterium]|nr:hypothetical protein [Actinomycetota bacterium]